MEEIPYLYENIILLCIYKMSLYQVIFMIYYTYFLAKYEYVFKTLRGLILL